LGLDALRDEGRDIVKREAEAPIMTKEITYPYDTSGLYYSPPEPMAIHELVKHPYVASHSSEP
jgi:hypothetical protein